MKDLQEITRTTVGESYIPSFYVSITDAKEILEDCEFWKSRSEHFEMAIKTVRCWLTPVQLRQFALLCRGQNGPCICGAHEGTVTME